MSSPKLLIIAFLALSNASAQSFADASARFTHLELEWSGAALPLIERQPAVAAIPPEAAGYVTTLGNRLASLATQGWPILCRFVVYDDAIGLDIPYFGRLRRVPGAATLPGGIVLVPVSLFGVSADESEFAAGLARGVAHVWLRHVMRASGTGTRDLQPFLKSWIFPRNLEREADYAAAALLARTGFDPQALSRNVHNPLASFDRSRPRAQWVDAAVRAQPQREYSRNTGTGFLLLKALLGGPVAAL